MSKRIVFEENIQLSDSDDESKSAVALDGDTCSSSEIDKLFKIKYKIAHESATKTATTSASMKRDFVIKLCSDNLFTKVVAGLSDGSIHIYDISRERGLTTFGNLSCSLPCDSSASICGLHFLNRDSNILVTGTTVGDLFLYDLRAQCGPITFTSDAKNVVIPKDYTCLDTNANSRLVCVGTEKHCEIAHLLFFDIRERKLMGCYSESHENDVTDVKFHSWNPDILCSGSTDGLINIFDLQESLEDDALLNTFNTENCVYKLNWFKNVYGKDFISCITSTNDLKIYSCEDYNLLAEHEWPKITAAIKRKAPSNCHLINTHNTLDNGIFALVGTNFNKGDIMRSVFVLKDQMVPLANFEGNKQIIRDSVFEMNSNTLITAGESGFLTLWMQQAGLNNLDGLKEKVKRNSYKIKPY